MSHSRRRKEDHDIYKPLECPEYSDPEFFTIKLYHGGEMKVDPKCYVGGVIDYFDGCSVDKISMLDLGEMLVECGELGGFFNYWYRFPGTDMERGCFDLVDDEELMLMCTMLQHKYVEVFAIVVSPLASSQPEINTQNVDYEYADETFHSNQEEHNFRDFEFVDSTQAEMREEEEMREVFGSDFGTAEEGEDEGSLDLVESDSEDGSFFSDSSNKDESDDDLLFDENVDDLGTGDTRFADEGGDESDHSTIYAESEDERMVGNSTDEDEFGYPVYNEAANVSPVFELGMCFKDSKTFRDAVKRHAIFNFAVKRDAIFAPFTNLRSKHVAAKKGKKPAVKANQAKKGKMPPAKKKN